jgi:hypothetical protein
MEEVVMKRMTALTAGAVLVACVACGRNDSSAVGSAQNEGDHTNAEMASTREADGEKGRAVTLEGCLQQGDGTFTRGYLLTMVNEPSTAGTAGSVTSTGSSVEREQLRMAASTFRLDPKGDMKLGEMLGKRVRVAGTVSEQAQAPNGAGSIGSDRDSQKPDQNGRIDRDHGVQLATSDLAQVDVTSAAVVGDACGGNTGRETSGRTSDKADTDREPRSRR